MSMIRPVCSWYCLAMSRTSSREDLGGLRVMPAHVVSIYHFNSFYLII
jgi:hypothetical protein